MHNVSADLNEDASLPASAQHLSSTRLGTTFHVVVPSGDLSRDVFVSCLFLFDFALQCDPVGSLGSKNPFLYLWVSL